MYQSTPGIMLIQNMYRGVDYKGAEFVGNKCTNTRLYYRRLPPLRRLCCRGHLFVCLFASRITQKNYSTNFYKIHWKDGTWAM